MTAGRQKPVRRNAGIAPLPHEIAAMKWPHHRYEADGFRLTRSERLKFLFARPIQLLQYICNRRRRRLGTTPLDLGEPWFVYGAIRFLKRTIVPGGKVFEYGAGGSTVFFHNRGCDVTTVEHDPSWASATREKLRLLGFSGERVTCHAADAIPPDPGFPSHGQDQCPLVQLNFRTYCDSILTYPPKFFDLVVVDGRARSSCLYYARDRVRPGGWILLDNSERGEYQQGTRLLRDEARTDFFGIGPTTNSVWCTSVWRLR